MKPAAGCGLARTSPSAGGTSATALNVTQTFIGAELFDR